MGETSVPGLYAAGNVTDPSQQVLQAAADGTRVGAMISFDLAHDDIEAAARPSANEADWDHRYGGEQMWSGNPNGTLVDELGDLTAGRALDVGAGEGADAIWLAEQGWEVTASDISRQGARPCGGGGGAARAADRVPPRRRQRARPLRRGRVRPGVGPVRVDPAHADGRGVRNLLDAVAPGGSLLVVSHDLEPMRTPIDTEKHSRLFDPDAYVRVDDVVAALAEAPEWVIDVHEKRMRPPGSGQCLAPRRRRRPARPTPRWLRGVVGQSSSRCVRAPVRSSTIRTSAGSSIAVMACGVIVENSADSPASTTSCWSPSVSRTTPSRTNMKS